MSRTYIHVVQKNKTCMCVYMREKEKYKANVIINSQGGVIWINSRKKFSVLFMPFFFKSKMSKIFNSILEENRIISFISSLTVTMC